VCFPILFYSLHKHKNAATIKESGNNFGTSGAQNNTALDDMRDIKRLPYKFQGLSTVTLLYYYYFIWADAIPATLLLRGYISSTILTLKKQ